MPRAVLTDPADLPEEGWDDPARGGIRWRTLLSRPLTDSDTFTCGLASLTADQHWVVHTHPQPEIYFGVEGECDVEVDGRLHRLAPERLLFVPGGAPHGIPRTSQAVRFFYAFAADSFEEVAYAFPDGAA